MIQKMKEHLHWVTRLFEDHWTIWEKTYENMTMKIQERSMEISILQENHKMTFPIKENIVGLKNYICINVFFRKEIQEILEVEKRTLLFHSVSSAT